MIEFITIIALILVAGMAGIAWMSKKRLDNLQDEVFRLTDEVRALRHQAKNPEYYEMARQYPSHLKGATRKELRAYVGLPMAMTREEQMERAKQNAYADALNNALRKAEGE